MVKELEPPQELLPAALHECGDLRGPEKTVAMNQPDDFAVAVGKLDRGNWLPA